MVKPATIEQTTIECTAEGATHKAFKIGVLVGKKEKEIWIARSILSADTIRMLEEADQGEALEIEMPLWLAEKEKLV